MTTSPAHSDEDLRQAVRSFVDDFLGEWRWSSIALTMNCRLFQLTLSDAVGLVDGTGNHHIRGSGCLVVAPARRLTARLTGLRRRSRNLPAPGRKVSELANESMLSSSRQRDPSAADMAEQRRCVVA